MIHILPDFLDMQNWTFAESSQWSDHFEPILVGIEPTWKFTHVQHSNDLSFFDLYLQNESLNEFHESEVILLLMN